MREIKRTLGELKNKVLDAETKGFSGDVNLYIELKPEERDVIAKDACGDLICAFAKKIAEEKDETKNWRSDDWDEFNENVLNDIVEKASFIDFEMSMDACEGFVNTLENKVDKILDDMAAKMYEVTITITAKVDVTIPVLAKSRDDAEDWVKNMSYSDIDDYREDDMEIDDTDIQDVDECTNMGPDDYGDYEDAT